MAFQKVQSRVEIDPTRRAGNHASKLPARLDDFAIPRILPARRAGDAIGEHLGTQAATNPIVRDLVTLSESAEAFLAGSKRSEAQLRNILSAGVERFRGAGQRVPYNYGLVSALLQHGETFGVDQPCRERIVGRMRALQAAFSLDFRSEVRGATLTRAANAMIDHGLTSLGREAWVSGERGAPDRPTRPSMPAAPGDLGDPGGPGMPPGSMEPGEPVGPDGGGFGRPPEPELDTPPPSFCDELGVLLGQSYVDYAVGTDGDPWARRLGSVWPRCIAFDALEHTVFHATPSSGEQFGAEQPSDVRLLFGDTEITVISWAANEITFMLPAGSHSGALILQGPFMARNGLSSAALGRILGIGSEMIGYGVRMGAGVPIGVIQPPEIRLFRVNETDVTNLVVELEACRDEARIVWQVGMRDTPGLGVPDCANLQVQLLDGQGGVLGSASVAAGHLTLPPAAAGERAVEVVATITFDGTVREARRLVTLRRESRLRIELRAPSRPQLIGSQSGVARVSLSCAAPLGGVRVDLQSSTPTVLGLHRDFVVIREGETWSDVGFHSLVDRYGHATVTARAVGYDDVQLDLQVLEPHTAVVLSGGGAKGSFEAGAISYLLHHEWTTLRVRTIVGTSVGAINALGLAHNEGVGTAYRVEREWLALQKNRDMFKPGDWLTQYQRRTGVDMAGMLEGIIESGGGGRFSLGLEPWQYTLAALPIVGAVMGGVAASTVEEYINLFQDYLAGRVIDQNNQLVAASSLFDLGPTCDRLTSSIDVQRIAAGGLAVRLCMVALHDGRTYYMDERGHLLHREQDPTGRDVLVDEEVAAIGYAHGYRTTPGTLTDRLVAGALGSSAIPCFLAPVRIDTPSTLHMMVDGGVREVLPVREAIEEGARLLVCIAASHPDVIPEVYGPSRNLFDIGTRGLGIQGSEVSREDRLDAARTCRGDLEMVMIEPDPNIRIFEVFEGRSGEVLLGRPHVTEVHGTFEIDSARIRINLAYGYMRAADEFFRRNNPSDPEEYGRRRQSTKDILEKRLAIHSHETRVLNDLYELGGGRAESTVRPPTVVAWTRPIPVNALRMLRVLKHELFQLVYDRFTRFGADSLPKGFGDPGYDRKDGILDWWMHWEIRDPRTMPNGSEDFLSGRPFERQLVRMPDRSFFEEVNPPPAPIVPADFLVAMT